MMAATSGQSFSLLLSKCLDSLGYGYRNIKASQFAAEMVENSTNECIKRLSDGDPAGVACIAGSKKEGISFFTVDSDFDAMMIWSSFHCSDKSQGGKVFKMQLRDVPDGYTLLEKTQNTSIIKEQRNTVYLSHYDEIFFNAFSKTGDMHGPSITVTIPDYFSHIDYGIPIRQRQTGPSLEQGQDLFQNKHYITQDFVPVMVCECSYYLNKWCKRRRQNNHPPRDQIQEIAKLDAHIAPVGCKNTGFMHYQWRICYTMAEIALIQSFNPTQYKVYVLLRMLSKEVIKIVCSAITSYVVKNVILWVSELYPLTLFQENNIPHCLVTCLKFLRRCVRERYLPNYMIQDRNLFFGIPENSFVTLSHLLKHLISEGGMAVKHCGWILPRLQLFSRIDIPQEIIDKVCSISLFIFMALLGNVLKQPSQWKVISCLKFLLNLIDRTASGLQGINHMPLLMAVKICKRITKTSLMHATSGVSDYKEVIVHTLYLEKHLSDSIEAYVGEKAKQFLTKKIQSMAKDDNLHLIALFINNFTQSNVYKHFMRTFIENIVETYALGTPDQQKSHHQQLLQFIPYIQETVSSFYGMESFREFLTNYLFA